MDTLEFLRAVLGSEGFYCAVGLKKNSDKRVQKFYTSVEDLVAVGIQLKDNEFDAYYALATFVEGTSRKAVNAKALKCFFLDLDCGASKPYATQSKALIALKEFCKDVGLPRPLLVNSGRGVHVYWPLEVEVPAAQWFPIAQSLKERCASWGLHADPSVTSDVSRILRIPGTFNFKGDTPVAVDVLGTGFSTTTLEKIRGAVGFLPITAKSFAPREMDDATKALLGSYVNKFKIILIKTANKMGCQQLGHIMTKQSVIEEPLWRAGLSIAQYCIDRDKAIHALSKHHPDYNFKHTENKASQTKGPYTCDTFEKLNPGGCEGCSNRKLIRSPISLGRYVEEATEEDNIVVAKAITHPTAPPNTYVIPKYPAPYLRGKQGGVFKRVHSENGDVEVPIYHNDLYVVRRIVDPEVGEGVLLRLHLPKDGVREFIVPLTAVGSRDEFRKHVAPQGVLPKKIEDVMWYISDSINHLQMNTIADVAKRQFGWTDDTLTAFTVGDQEIRANSILPNPPSKSTADLFSCFREKGTLEGWKETMEFYNKPGYELHQFCIGLGFGSPLMAFTAVNAVIVHLHSPQTGLGKTNAIEAAASIWGNPVTVATKEDDTMNFRMNRAEIYKNIILPVDEMTNATPKELSEMLYKYPAGMQRGRMGSSTNQERYRGEAWQQLCLSTGNVGIIPQVALFKAMPKGEAARVLEILVTAADLPPKEVTDVLSLRLRQHYGTAYLPYMQFLMSDIEGARTLYHATKNQLDTAIGMTAAHRFYSAACGCDITGLMLAKRAGLIPFKISNIVRWLISTMKNVKLDVEDIHMEPETILNNFLAENYTNILRIKSTEDSRVVVSDVDMLIIPDSTPRVSLVARYEYDIKKLYLLPKPLKDWCGKHQINYVALFGALQSGRTKAVMEKKRMSRGTRMNLPAAYVLRIDCKEFMDDETESALATSAADVITQVGT